MCAVTVLNSTRASRRAVPTLTLREGSQFPGVHEMMTRRMAIFLAGLMPGLATQAHAQQRKLLVMVFRGGPNLPLFAAQEKDFFARRGLNVRITYAPSADELPRVLAEGRVQIIHSTADNAIKILDADKLDVALVI